MKRIYVVGTSGCGKTTFAKRLGSVLNIQCIDLDDYYWLPKWQIQDKDTFEHTVKNFINQQYWIISGNYSQVRQQIFDKADKVIWLDYSFLRCMLQALKRSLSRSLFKIPCCNGNFETLKRTFFSVDSIILWIINTYYKRKNFYEKVFKHVESETKYIQFSRPKQAHLWLNSI